MEDNGVETWFSLFIICSLLFCDRNVSQALRLCGSVSHSRLLQPTTAFQSCDHNYWVNVSAQPELVSSEWNLGLYCSRKKMVAERTGCKYGAVSGHLPVAGGKGELEGRQPEQGRGRDSGQWVWWWLKAGGSISQTSVTWITKCIFPFDLIMFDLLFFHLHPEDS